MVVVVGLGVGLLIVILVSDLLELEDELEEFPP